MALNLLDSIYILNQNVELNLEIYVRYELFRNLGNPLFLLLNQTMVRISLIVRTKIGVVQLSRINDVDDVLF